MQKIQTKAKAFGTFVSPSTGGILYVDPNHDSEVHHSPTFTRAEAEEAFRRGLIEDPEDGEMKDIDPAAALDPNAIGTVAAERTAHHAKADHEVAPQPSTLDSRQSTAWPDADRVQGGAEGYADGVRVDENADADAAPPPTRRGRAPAAST